MFIGEYQHNIDDKGRLSIPAKLRTQCSDVVYVTKGNEGCLAVYTEEGWNAYYNDLMKLPRTKKKVREFIRAVTSRARDCEFDKLGRINIPLVLRNEAKIVKECTIIGAGDHIEIWNSEVWENYYNNCAEDFDDNSEDFDFE